MAIFAIDLGGTNIRAAAVNRSGQVVSAAQMPTPKGLRPSRLISIISGLFRDLSGAIGPGGAIEAAGIAVPAPAAEDGEGILTKVPNIPTIEGMQLGGPLKDQLRIPVVIENDATAAAIGEQWLGASRRARTSILFTLGTGIGGGLIVDGRPYRGPDGSAGEIGHFCVERNGEECGCGSRGCLEQYASAQGILRLAIRSGIDAADSKDVYLAAIAGDRTAKKVFSEAGCYLGIVAAGLINTLNPDMIVFGGKVSEAFELFAPAMRAEVRRRAFPEPAKRCRIVKSKLGDTAGLLGAARSAMLRASSEAEAASRK
jgi:glucokinase